MKEGGENEVERVVSIWKRKEKKRKMRDTMIISSHQVLIHPKFPYRSPCTILTGQNDMT